MSTTGYVPTRVIKAGDPVSLTASQTVVVTDTFRVTAEDSLNFLAIFNVSAVSGTVDITLEHSADGSNWDAIAKTGTISGTGRTQFSLLATLAGDQASLPLRPLARFKLATGGGESITVTDIVIARRI